MRINGILICLIICSLLIINCTDDPPDTGLDDLTGISYSPRDYNLQIPNGFPSLAVEPENPMTYDGVQLGRHLFYDPILSSDSTLACASCHSPDKAFTDGTALSKGVLGMEGTRSSMSLLNVAYFNKGLFWDGRASTLEKQALEPVTNPVELHETWSNVEIKLKRHAKYPELFRKAFGISKKTDITKELAVKAISQFERILLTGGNSLYARQTRGEVFFNIDQQEGMDMFLNLDPALPDAQCGHCHAPPMFAASDFFNNGLEKVTTLEDFKDKGRGAVTGLLSDNGKFKASTLINIHLTAPYMHDGRFNTLEDVMTHYTSTVHFAPNLDPNVAKLKLNEKQKNQVLEFLKTIIDTSYLQNPDIFSPF
ncbi:MAG: cytochrome C peroxidase [Bacteroidota bacterium]|nr:cytochrome C peroxidase [Bacteroidota bacterium]